jgi:hypothetical protein
LGYSTTPCPVWLLCSTNMLLTFQNISILKMQCMNMYFMLCFILGVTNNIVELVNKCHCGQYFGIILSNEAIHRKHCYIPIYRNIYACIGNTAVIIVSCRSYIFSSSELMKVRLSTIWSERQKKHVKQKKWMFFCLLHNSLIRHCINHTCTRSQKEVTVSAYIGRFFTLDQIGFCSMGCLCHTFMLFNIDYPLFLNG